MDQRLRSAVDASLGWYNDICTLHGIGASLTDGLWSSHTAPPPLHSDAVVVEPCVTAHQILSRLEGRVRAGVKDSFAAVDLSADGMSLLFTATWIFREAADPPRVAPPAWSIVENARELAVWTAHHDTAGVLLPGVLERAHFRILAKRVDGQLVAGAVARLGSGIVDVSNVYSVPGHHLDWAELADVVGWCFPARPLVGYERGDDLDAAITGGFVPTGDLRVWVR